MRTHGQFRLFEGRDGDGGLLGQLDATGMPRPVYKAWYALRFRIDDPRFVNYWGYNFALESDGNTYNRYLLNNVTVTKLKQ